MTGLVISSSMAASKLAKADCIPKNILSIQVFSFYFHNVFLLLQLTLD